MFRPVAMMVPDTQMKDNGSYIVKDLETHMYYL